MARLSTGWIALPGVGHCEAHAGEALVVVESPAPFWTMLGHNALYLAVGFVWLHVVDDGEASVNEEAPDGYQLAALLCFFLFVDNLVGRLERGQPPAWQWLGSGQWQLLLLFASLALLCQLLYWSEAIRSDSHSP
jgi:hypothetical protein